MQWVAGHELDRREFPRFNITTNMNLCMEDDEAFNFKCCDVTTYPHFSAFCKISRTFNNHILRALHQAWDVHVQGSNLRLRYTVSDISGVIYGERCTRSDVRVVMYGERCTRSYVRIAMYGE